MAQSYSNLVIHLVFSTKDRGKDLTAAVRSELYRYLSGLADAQKAQLETAGGGLDHVHLLLNVSPTLAVSDLVRELKARSSKWIRNRFNPNFSWQSGYAAFSVSQSNVAQVFDYIRNQEAHHRRTTFEDEYISLLKKNEIDFEEKYLWG